MCTHTTYRTDSEGIGQRFVASRYMTDDGTGTTSVHNQPSRVHPRNQRLRRVSQVGSGDRSELVGEVYRLELPIGGPTSLHVALPAPVVRHGARVAAQSDLPQSHRHNPRWPLLSPRHQSRMSTPANKSRLPESTTYESANHLGHSNLSAQHGQRIDSLQLPA